MAINVNDLTREQIVQLWPQAADELSHFADHLDNTNSQLTASQLRMAIKMAEDHFQMSSAVAEAFDPTSAQHASMSYKGLLNTGENRGFSIDELKNTIAMVQKIYQIFMTVMNTIEPLLQPQPQPPAPPGSSGSIFGTPPREQDTANENKPE
jgi:hypothetical protein